MVDGSSMNRSKKLLQLLEGSSTFIINVHAPDETAAVEKMIANKESYKDARLLFQKDEIVQFYDKLKRPLGQLLDFIRELINNDPVISDPNGKSAGAMEIKPGDWVFFGCGKT